MTQTLATPEKEHIVLGSRVAGAVTPGTRRLLRAGIVAGPLFVGLAIIEMLAVPWFDITTQPLSVLNLGELGWMQKTNFIVSGLLVACAAVGLGRALRPGPASTWGARLVGVFGVGLVGAGTFDVDPSGGIPPGAPAEVSTDYSWHMYAHNMASMVAFLSLTIASLVFVRRFRRAGRRGWATYSALTGVTSISMFLWPDPDGVSLRLAVATVFMFAWVAGVCLLVLSEAKETVREGNAMSTVVSRDGTEIAYEVSGSGPALVIVGGVFSFRRFTLTLELVDLLANHFTVYNYDRRGRGDSGDTQPYSVDREIEDLDAVIAAAGGRAFVWGVSSGAGLALEAARAGTDIAGLALHEPPYNVDPEPKVSRADLALTVRHKLADGDRGGAVKYFMTKGMGMPRAGATLMRLMPATWTRLTAVAHTLPYDIEVMAPSMHPGSPELSRFAGITAPVILMAGTKSPAPLQAASRALAESIPTAEQRWLRDQNYVFKPAVVAPQIVEAFS